MFTSIKRFFDAHVAAVGQAADPVDRERAYQLATAALLIEMTRADHEVKSIEREAVTQALQRAFDLDGLQTAELMTLAEQDVNEATSLYEFTRLINNNFDPTQKEHFMRSTNTKIIWCAKSPISSTCRTCHLSAPSTTP
jgi:uncharacterized tellurite resistance protein B-like protein